MPLITFEGCDFSGKSTQVQLLKQYLEHNNSKVCVTKEPGGTYLAQKIRDIILSDIEIQDPLIEYLLIAAARRDHYNKFIKSQLQQGYYVISDRFYDSSVCYQGYYKGLDFRVLQVIKDITIGKFVPHLTFLINTSLEEVLKRKTSARSGNNFYDRKDIEFYSRVIKHFLQIAYVNPGRIFVINGNQSSFNVHKEIVNIFKVRYSF